MTGTTRARLIYGLAIVSAATPFAFGLIHGLRTGSDYRYLWLALATMVGGVLAKRVVRRRGVLTTTLFVSVVATVFGVFASWLLGTAPSVVVLMVSVSFSLCVAGPTALQMLARPRRPEFRRDANDIAEATQT